MIGFWPVFFVLGIAACGSEGEKGGSGPGSGGQPIVEDTGIDTGGPPDDSGDPPQGPLGFIGSPCLNDEECAYDGGVCLTDGFPEGMCSLPCDNICPDESGHPVTFCVDADALPSASLSGGWCVSRCDFQVHPSMGCRADYGCVIESRYNEGSTENYSCIPGDETDLNDCHYSLADRGIAFEPTVRGEEHPEGRPDLTCRIEDPVWVLSPVFGVDLEYYDGTPTPRTRAACEMAHALGDTVADVVDQGVTSLLHIGTYNCRVIAGTSDLSRHSFADAIDIYGFGFEDGREWTLVDHWEHDTTSFDTDAGEFLYDAAYRWYDDWVWNIILTPNYNLAHDNHFHVDLSPGSHYVGATDGRYIGPALYVD